MTDISVHSPEESILSAVSSSHQTRLRYPAYVGIDQHAAQMEVAVALEGRDEPESWGRFANSPKGVKRLLKKVGQKLGGQVVSFCYEAGPCGFGLYRTLHAAGHDCLVVAPSTIPQPSQRRKTDRRDALDLAKLHRSGLLSSIDVPDEEQEMMRDLSRCRSDAKEAQRKARQKLLAYLLRHEVHYDKTQSNWTKTHRQWLNELTLDEPLAQVTLTQYVDMERAATERLAEIEQLIHGWLPRWSTVQWVYDLKALRGIDTIAAVALVAELGDLRRFRHPRQLMAFLGLVPGERSTGQTHRRLSTGTGNRHARRALIEAAWCYRFPPRQTAHLKRAMVNSREDAKSISWKAQKRLCGRYQTLVGRGKSTKKVVVAIARELSGFLWAIYQTEPMT